MQLRKLLGKGVQRGPELFTVKKSEHPNLYGRIREVQESSSLWQVPSEGGSVFKTRRKGEMLGGEARVNGGSNYDFNGDCEKEDDHECGENRSRLLRTSISSAG